MEEIALWAEEPEMIRACEAAVHAALRAVGIEARLIVNSEPPLIARHGLAARLPALEIRQMYWTLRPGRAFTESEVTALLRTVFR